MFGSFQIWIVSTSPQRPVRPHIADGNRANRWPGEFGLVPADAAGLSCEKVDCELDRLVELKPGSLRDGVIKLLA
jgi:hypothetical protein